MVDITRRSTAGSRIVAARLRIVPTRPLASLVGIEPYGRHKAKVALDEVCRLHFNRSRKYVGVFDEARKETKHAIDNLEGIFGLREQLRASALRLAGTKDGDGEPSTS